MNERKELLVYDMSGNFADKAEPCYKKEDVDPLLDKYEENIKELAKIINETNERIKELEDKIRSNVNG